jgi:hypothetical protein
MAKQLRHWAASHLGVCQRCMRQAFAAAIASILCAVLLGIALGAVPVAFAASAVSLALIVLWCAHLVAYSLRAVALAAAARRPAHSVARHKDRSRREIVPLFAKAFVFVALASTIGARSAHACVQLPIGCSSNNDCKCSGCCGSWDGNTKTGICQPSC